MALIFYFSSCIIGLSYFKKEFEKLLLLLFLFSLPSLGSSSHKTRLSIIFTFFICKRGTRMRFKITLTLKDNANAKDMGWYITFNLQEKLEKACNHSAVEEKKTYYYVICLRLLL